MIKRQPYTKTGKPMIITVNDPVRKFIEQYSLKYNMSMSAVVTLAIGIFELEYHKHNPQINNGEIHTPTGENRG